MILGNGYISFAAEDGSMSLPIPANIRRTRQSLQTTEAGEATTSEAYEVLVEGLAELPSEFVTLLDSNRASIGEYAVKSAFFHAFVNAMQICL